jgi:adenine C2-methylase RlmN of 23S rRNA A2503 and tRNA A37
MTFCISTQVGCAMACDFLPHREDGAGSPSDPRRIAAQVRVLASATDSSTIPFNIVLMGMGEPLHNYDNTMKALRILHAEHGLAISPRRVTLSTVGIVPALDRLASEPLMPNLAISLHATTDEQRRRWCRRIASIRLRRFSSACRPLSLEEAEPDHVRIRDARRGQRYTLRNARRSRACFSGIKAKVNLIPLNPAPRHSVRAPVGRARRSRSPRVLADRHITVSVRKSRGRDIRAACGQLIVEGGTKKSAAQQIALLCMTRPEVSSTSSSGAAPPIFATSSCLTFSTLNLFVDAIILSMTSSKSNSVDFEKRIGFTRAYDKRLQIGARQPFRLERRHHLPDGVVQLQHLRRAPLPLLERLRDRLFEKVVYTSQHRMVCAAAEAPALFVRRAECEIGRLLELERVVGLEAGLALGQRTRHPDGLERLLFDVVRFLRVERKDLERHLGLGHEHADDGPRAELLHRLQAMVPFGVQYPSSWRMSTSGSRKRPTFSITSHQLLHVRV